MKKNIVFIGMPSSGKTTTGRLIAEKLGKAFVDTDEVIRLQEKRELRDIVIEDGLSGFLQLQETAILGLDCPDCVIATGGSVVYSPAAMEHLKAEGAAVYLKLGLDELKSRLAEGRRFARNSSQSYEDLFYERAPLYEKYADITVDCSSKSAEEIVSEILKDFMHFI